MNKTTILCLLAVGLLSSCGQHTICPAYQSAFILDDESRAETFSLFTVFEGDTVPKRPYGYKYSGDHEEMDKFLRATPGKGYRMQGNRAHPFEKEGFSYPNRVSEKIWVKAFRPKEQAVLGYPYRFSRAKKNYSFAKLDQLDTRLVHFNTLRYDSLVRQRVNRYDTTAYDALMADMNDLPQNIQRQYSPLMRSGFNREQKAYDDKFGKYFPKPPVRVERELLEEEILADSLVTDSLSTKKGFLGIFKRKGKERPSKEKRQDKKRNTSANREEENNR